MGTTVSSLTAIAGHLPLIQAGGNSPVGQWLDAVTGRLRWGMLPIDLALFA
jgi:hypothetical protein